MKEVSARDASRAQVEWTQRPRTHEVQKSRIYMDERVFRCFSEVHDDVRVAPRVYPHVPAVVELPALGGSEDRGERAHVLDEAVLHGGGVFVVSRLTEVVSHHEKVIVATVIFRFPISSAMNRKKPSDAY